MGTQQGTKNEVEKLQDKFTKEFENLANKILEEKSNKTEQNKENMKSILSPLQEKIHLFEKSRRRYAQRKHRLPCSFAPTDSRFTRNECPNE
jgi:DNA anti-recombination protein RmuC